MLGFAHTCARANTGPRVHLDEADQLAARVALGAARRAAHSDATLDGGGAGLEDRDHEDGVRDEAEHRVRLAVEARIRRGVGDVDRAAARDRGVLDAAVPDREHHLVHTAGNKPGG